MIFLRGCEIVDISPVQVRPHPSPKGDGIYVAKYGMLSNQKLSPKQGAQLMNATSKINTLPFCFKVAGYEICSFNYVS